MVNSEKGVQSMKKRAALGMATAAVLALVSVAWAADAKDQPVRFKSGDLTFTILKSDGVTPVEGTEVKVKKSARSKALSEGVTDKQGQVVIALAAGGYVLNVSGRNISDLTVADDALLTECRVVLDDDKAGLLLAGGGAAAATETGASVGAGSSFTTIAVGGVAVMVAAGVGYAIYDHNKDDDDDSEPELPPTEPARPTSRPRTSTR